MAYHLIKGFSFVFVLTTCTSSGFLLDTTPTYACVDQQPTCDVFNSSFAVCKDLHHAYQICRKFCGLCNVVHGGWSVWSAWGVCDATCDNGTMTRTRQCNNPQPLNGGEDCQGPSKNNGECLLNRCPTHGGWSAWNGWGSCSVTCGVGLRRRDRACDNPWPSSDGNHCFGDNINYEICSERVCATWTDWASWSSCSETCGYGLKERYRNCSGTSEMQSSCVGSDVQNVMCKTSCNENRSHGGWSAWNGWGSCSVTCGVGLRRRDRACDNPWPSSDGNHCFGDNINYEICSERVCATWTDWGSWSSCSDTCGYGLKERYRNCSGTSEMQNSCVGSDVQNVMCKTACHLTNVLFHARTPKETALSSSQIAIFTTVEVNTGQGYDSNTGKFTAPVSGVYMFAIQYCTEAGKYGCLQIVKDGTALQSSVNLAGGNIACYSMQTFATVAVGEQVWLQSNNAWSSPCFLHEINSFYWSSFAGVLIHT